MPCAPALAPCSDVDIATLQNPFDHLYRDSDVEGMTDGFDPLTAYGEIYGIDDATMVRQQQRGCLALNSSTAAACGRVCCSALLC